ncbi:MAG: hypothetical protein P4L74_04330 [Candidatus Doudnabacteria bacterium]|nr:hypothetical protein [Candidatus Doudnabacteria bacterium]
MSILNNIRNKSPEQKFRIMWTVAVVIVIVMIAVWVVSAHYYKNVPKDTTLFQSLGKGFKDVRDNYQK